jgi:hypothetical protein
MIKGSSQFFTISQVEVWLSQNAGYQAKLFAEVCLQQPQDQPTAVRALNIFKEFRDIFKEGIVP